MKLITPIPENYYTYAEKEPQNATLVWGILSYGLIFSIVPFIIFANKNKFIYHHARQGLVQFVLFVLSFLFVFIPKIGDVLLLIAFMLHFSLSVTGIILYSKKLIFEIPLIGHIARLLKVSIYD